MTDIRIRRINRRNWALAVRDGHDPIERKRAELGLPRQ